MARLLLLLLCALLSTPAVAQLGMAGGNIRPELVTEGPAPPGGEVELAILMTPKEGWHGYWQNPGDAGQPMTVTWDLPPGVTAGPLRYPVPTRLSIAGLMNYVYKGPYAVLVRLRVPDSLSGTGQMAVRADLQYLACTDEICVPERGSVALNLPVDDSTLVSPRFDEWRAKLPKPIGAPAFFVAEGDRLRIGIPLPRAIDVAEPYLFPLTEDVADYAAPQTFRRTGDLLIAELPIKAAPSAGFTGLVDLGQGRGLLVESRPGVVPGGGSLVSGPGSTLLWALLGAIAGGLILNLMPCVFPILALKALALARAGGEARDARTDALAYTAGAILGTGALGAVLLLIRAGGSAAGWAFQLQDPRTVLVLLLLATAITLNLLGVFRLPVLGGDATPKSGFATGALAAFVATPCAGPFMGAALGAALLLPTAGAMLVFAGLGLGLALPFLLLAFIPALRRRLPKPGPWMIRLQRLLAIPMALTVAACAWLLWRQGGTEALAIGLAAAILIGLLLGGWRLAQDRERRLGLAAALGAVGVAGAAAAALPASSQVSGPVEGAEPWSETAVEEARQRGRPVFVYFTADWCLTCKVNEAGAIDRDNVRDAFAKRNVAVFAADWTNGDPAITRFLDRQARAGVPLYLWYGPGRDEPEELPQVLTPGMLIERAGA